MAEGQNGKEPCFSLQVQDEGVFLIVLPAAENQSSLVLAAILSELQVRKVVAFDRVAIDEAIRLHNGQSQKIADSPQQPPPAEISVIVSRDRMEAFLQIDLPNGATKPPLEEIIEKIAKAGITSGMIPDAPEQALRQPGIRVICAQGQTPENGTDASLVYYVDTENKGRPAELSDGSVDFKNLNIYTNVEEGQVLAQKIPATKGIEGKDICGNPVPPKAGKEINLTHGANVEIQDGTKLVATKAGHLVRAGDKLAVSPILEVKGDVDLSTGNIDFTGDVVVRGSVQNGFLVKAGGNVEISGLVSGGDVEGRDINVRMGILGMNRTKINASGTVVAKFIENARVSADENIIVHDVVLHSQLSACKSIVVDGRRGQVVGGVAIAGESITAKSVGTTLATATELQAGVNPKIRDEYHVLRKELKVLEENLDQMQKGLFQLRSVDAALLPPEKRELMLKLTRAQFSLMNQAETMRKRMGELEEILDNMKAGQIRISDYVYPGVKIVLGALIKPIQDMLRFVVFYAEAGEIKFRPLK